MIPILILAIEDDDDREFMTNLYLENKYILYAEIQKILSDPWAAEDALQDALVELIDRIPLLRQLEKRKCVNYMITTVRNKAKDSYKKAKKTECVSLDDTDNLLFQAMASNEDLEADAFEKLESERTNAIWRELSENSKQILERRYILEQSNEEIAEAFHVKPSSVRMMLTRARSELRELMENAQSVS